MPQYVDLPDGWKESNYETGPKRGDEPYTEELDAMWLSPDEACVVDATESVDVNGVVSYPVTVVQHLVGERYAIDIQTHARLADDRKEAEQIAVEFMTAVNNGQHQYRLLGVHEPEDSDFLQFFTISDSELPGKMEARQLIDLLERVENDENNIDGLPDDVPDDLPDVQVDIFPRHREEVRVIDGDTE